MVRGVLCGFAMMVVLAAPAVAEAQKPCLALDVPLNQSQVSVVGNYAGKQFEFRISVDGKPVDLEQQKKAKEVAAACAYTS